MLNKNDDCFCCRHCGALPPGGMDDKLIDVLNKLSVSADEINSAYRCSEHNAAIGGAKNSQHVLGCAADIDATMRGVDELAEQAEVAGADGIGKYYDDCFVHIDTRGERARW